MKYVVVLEVATGVRNPHAIVRARGLCPCGLRVGGGVVELDPGGVVFHPANEPRSVFEPAPRYQPLVTLAAKQHAEPMHAMSFSESVQWLSIAVPLPRWCVRGLVFEQRSDHEDLDR